MTITFSSSVLAPKKMSPFFDKTQSDKPKSSSGFLQKSNCYYLQSEGTACNLRLYLGENRAVFYSPATIYCKDSELQSA